MRYVYLHGFASSSSSRKAVYFKEVFGEFGLKLEVPNLEQSDFEHITLSSQIRVLEELLRGEPAVLIGSSMGGYLASLYAEKHPEIYKLILLAPAFGFAARWSTILDPAAFRFWRESGWLEVYHYGDQCTRRVHYKLIEDALQLPEEPSFQQPALIFHGAADNVVPPDLSRHFVLVHPNAELVIEESDHELTDVLDHIAAKAIPFLLSSR